MSYDDVGSDGSDELKLSTLQTLTARLARITSSTEVASYVLNEGIVQLGGSSGSLCFVVADRLHMAASSGYPTDVVDTFRSFAIDSTTPAGECASSHKPVYCESVEKLYERYPIFRERPIVGDPSFAVLPLEASDSALLGTMVIGFATPQGFQRAARALLEAIAREASVAIERARANEALVEARAIAEQARDQLEFLAAASTSLAASLDLVETMRTVERLASPKVADRCALFLLENAEIKKFALGPDLNEDEMALFEWRSPAIEDEVGIGAVIRTGEPVFVPDVERELPVREVATPGYVDLLRRVGVGGTCLVPLKVRAATIGALAFVNHKGRPFTLIERALAEELSSRAAMAVDNARLFSREVRIAETLQHALLPELPKLGEIEIAARYLPGVAGVEVGGDWYDVIRLDNDRCTFVVGDVSGRGLPAATTMASLRFATRAYVAQGDGPAVVLQKLGMLLDFEHQQQFATVLVGEIDLARQRVVFASAGHLPPLLVAEGGSTFVEIPPAMPIGVGEEVCAQSISIDIPGRAMLLAYTDGLVERRGEHLDDGLARLRELVGAQRGSLDAVLERILSGLMLERATDDAVILGLRWRA